MSQGEHPSDWGTFMKVQMIFDLPQEAEEYKLASNGSKYYCALWDILDLLREKRKYGEPSEEIEELSTKIYEILAERNIEI